MLDASAQRETPLEFLSRVTGSTVRVVLKWGTVYEGVLDAHDPYMNVVLRQAAEIGDFEDRPEGDILIRCNNIKAIEEK